MKLTEEQKKQIRNLLYETPNYYRSGDEYREGIEDTAKWAIEKFGGIQWKEYPETKPTEDGHYLVVDTEGTVVVWTWICKIKDQWREITYWAEINLPNQ
jgi:hypothetical protein